MAGHPISEQVARLLTLRQQQQSEPKRQVTAYTVSYDVEVECNDTLVTEISFHCIRYRYRYIDTAMQPSSTCQSGDEDGEEDNIPCWR
jgi:hypothetical protein